MFTDIYPAFIARATAYHSVMSPNLIFFFYEHWDNSFWHQTHNAVVVVTIINNSEFEQMKKG